MGAEYSQYGDECNFLLLQSLALKMPIPIQVLCQEPLILTYLASSNAFKPLCVPPPVPETLVSNLSVCLFQVSHLFLQFHPLGLWGCLH